jgi:hypothetical protein
MAPYRAQACRDLSGAKLTLTLRENGARVFTFSVHYR